MNRWSQLTLTRRASACLVILVDTSVRIDHLAKGETALAHLLEDAMVLGHPWVRGELMLGNLRNRGEVGELLEGLPQGPVASVAELDWLIERERLFGRGIGFGDAQLLASTRLVSGARLWTNDKRLADIARELSIAY